MNGALEKMVLAIFFSFAVLYKGALLSTTRGVMYWNKKGQKHSRTDAGYNCLKPCARFRPIPF